MSFRKRLCAIMGVAWLFLNSCDHRSFKIDLNNDGVTDSAYYHQFNECLSITLNGSGGMPTEKRTPFIGLDSLFFWNMDNKDNLPDLVFSRNTFPNRTSVTIVYNDGNGNFSGCHNPIDCWNSSNPHLVGLKNYSALIG